MPAFFDRHSYSLQTFLLLFSMLLVDIGASGSFDSSESRLIRGQSDGREGLSATLAYRRPHRLLNSLDNNYYDDDSRMTEKRSPTSQFATVPLIRFGRSLSVDGNSRGMLRQARNQQLIDPLIRFGKRAPNANLAANAPLIRFGRRAPASSFGAVSQPLIRFGKRIRDEAESEAAVSPTATETSSPNEAVDDGGSGGATEIITTYIQPSVNDFLYTRYSRNAVAHRPIPTDEDTMLRFG